MWAKSKEVLANLGAAYGTAKSGVGIANLGVALAEWAFLFFLLLFFKL